MKSYGTSGNSISWVQVNLDNEISSPVFTNDQHVDHNPRAINFERAEKIRGVTAYDGPNYAHTIEFLDNAGDIIYTFNPLQYTYSTVTPYPIKENEEIIGVYGVKDTRKWFESFGFIVKVNN